MAFKILQAEGVEISDKGELSFREGMHWMDWGDKHLGAMFVMTVILDGGVIAEPKESIMESLDHKAVLILKEDPGDEILFAKKK